MKLKDYILILGLFAFIPIMNTKWFLDQSGIVQFIISMLYVAYSSVIVSYYFLPSKDEL